MGLFKSKLVDAEVAEWQFEKFASLIKNFSSGPGLPDSNLWLPISEHFPAWEESELPRANFSEHIFYLMKEQCCFDEGTIFDLVRAKTNKGALLGGGAMIQVSGNVACGSYQYEPRKYGRPIETITYDSGMESNPTQVIATFAHELSHALHNRSRGPLEVEPELYELFTDLTAVYLGYGVFLANSRFDVASNTLGWEAQGSGYLPEADLIFGTAVFMEIKSIPMEMALEHLKPRLKKMLIKAKKQLGDHKDKIDKLRDMTPTIFTDHYN